MSYGRQHDAIAAYMRNKAARDEQTLGTSSASACRHDDVPIDGTQGNMCTHVNETARDHNNTLTHTLPDTHTHTPPPIRSLPKVVLCSTSHFET